MTTSVVTRATPTAPGRADTRPAPLALVAFVLGVAAVALGVTVVWYFAAIPIGATALVVGILALRRTDLDVDPRARGRATTGAVLGFVAIVLGASAWYFLPRAVDDVSSFFTSVQADVNHNVDTVNRGLQSDVNRIDRTVSRDLRRLEDQNRKDLYGLERRNSEALSQLEARMNATVDKASGSARQDLTKLEANLRADIRAIDDGLRSTSSTFAAQMSTLDARIARVEKLLGIS
jgi:hypothetical protein